MNPTFHGGSNNNEKPVLLLLSAALAAGGKWTAVMSRKLVTGSKYDVQFDKLDATYDFGLAAFDNAQVRHAIHMGALKLKFAK